MMAAFIVVNCQVLVETGLAGSCCVIWFIIVLYRNGLKRFGSDGQDWRGVLRVAALVGCTGILVHSLFDFNLQVPANAALFYVFCALAAGLPANPQRLILKRTPFETSDS